MVKYEEPEKILLMTASPGLEAELCLVLNKYNVITVQNAKQALEYLKKDKEVAAVLAGIFLPETKGFDFLNYIKKHPNFYTGPILVVTDSISDSVISRTKSYDIFDFVVRYSDKAIIKARIRNAVVYYSEKRKLLDFAVKEISKNLLDLKTLVSVLAHVAEFKDNEFGKHIEQVGAISRIIGRELMTRYGDKYKLTHREVEYISIASALHDIGKIYIPDEIKNKPGALTPEEFEIMKTHAEKGAEIISNLVNISGRNMISYAYEICLYHHERWDGKGYPKGLKGNDIPIAAQIVSIADVYDALTNDRCYRKALSHKAAVTLIKKGGCGVFNPDLLDSFCEVGDEIEKMKREGDFDGADSEIISAVIEEICKVD